MKSDDLKATFQILNTILPYILLWICAVKVAAISVWFLPPIIALMILFSLRCFSLMHDCGHYSLFRSKRINRIVGFMLGLINAIPQYAWSRDHDFHHKTNGNWEKYRGVADFLSIEEFAQLKPSDQKSYELLRHPLMIFPGGFFYLAIKPRLALILGIYDFIRHYLTCLQHEQKMNFKEMIVSHQSKHWQSEAEFWDLLLNNICVVGGCIFLGYQIGFGLFFSIYSIILTGASAIFIAVFFVQHIFEGSYAHKTECWDYLRGAIDGSSYLQLPTILNWFTADIGYHNIHHLSERIPNYNLKACHHENIALLSGIKILHMDDMLACSKFILWNSQTNNLIPVAEFYQLNSVSQGK